MLLVLDSVLQTAPDGPYDPQEFAACKLARERRSPDFDCEVYFDPKFSTVDQALIANQTQDAQQQAK